MSRLPLSIPMSHIIATDAPLLSPVSITESSWDMHQPLCSPTADAFNYSYYNLPPSPPTSVGSNSTDSPIPSNRMLKMRMSPDSASEGEQLCLPTHQVFDFPPVAYPPTPPSPTTPASPHPHHQLQQHEQQHHHHHRASISSVHSSSTALAKRSASPAGSVTTKKRAVGERISSKDFVPPDVSGLSKREARLVKNRAAAFLSRQRKREEFECMEVRVAELEQENARLLTLAQNGSPAGPPEKEQPEKHFVSEIEQLRAQLAAAKERELELSAELAAKASACDTPVKVESREPAFPLSSPSRSSSMPASHKSGASLGLMVLLCALPTLLSMPTHSTAPTSFSLPTVLPASSSTFDFNSFMPNDYDWSRANGNSMMELDGDDRAKAAPTQTVARKLEFSSIDSEALGALGGLDISFDASPSDNGKIRVRIHPSSSASSRAASPGATSYTTSKAESSSSLGMWAGSEAEASFEASFSSEFSGVPVSSYPAPSAGGDPFLGIGSTIDYAMPYSEPASSMLYGQMGDMTSVDLSDSTFGYGSEFSVGDSTTGGKRRVRIALKSMPVVGGEGGEWEVQIC